MKGLEPLYKLYYHLKIKRIPSFATTAKKTGAKRFELLNVDIKNQCLTLWLYPKIIELVSIELTTLRLSGTCSNH